MSTNITLKLKQVWRFIVIFDKMINEFYVNFFSVQHFGMVCKFCCFVEQCSVSLEHNSLVNSYVLCWTLSEFGTMLHIAYQCTFIYKMMKCRNTFWLMYSKLKISIKDKQDYQWKYIWYTEAVVLHSYYCQSSFAYKSKRCIL